MQVLTYGKKLSYITNRNQTPDVGRGASVCDEAVTMIPLLYRMIPNQF